MTQQIKKIMHVLENWERQKQALKHKFDLKRWLEYLQNYLHHILVHNYIIIGTLGKARIIMLTWVKKHDLTTKQSYKLEGMYNN